MSSSDRPLLADLQAELKSMAADMREMIQLRWELARLELESDIFHIKRLAIIWVAAAVMAITALPLLVTYLAEKLDDWHGIARAQWLLIFGLSLIGLSLISAYGAWRWFRRRFIGLQETLEEFREDLQWLKERMKDEG
ncbi:MAG TPA: phage holin family protein [Thermoguttaceae bacterium]